MTKALFVACLLSILNVSPLSFMQAMSAQQVSIAKSALAWKVSLQPDGQYAIAMAGSNWILKGSLPIGFTVLPPSTGSDRIGNYQEVSARGEAGRIASIRSYEAKPLVLFVDKWEHAGTNDHAFPTFAALPADATRYSFVRDSFAHYEFDKLGEEGPWILFKGKQALVLSPADNFKISWMSVAPDGAASSAINGKIASLPDGFEHATLLAAGDGVNDAMGNWGAALQLLGRKKPVSNDADPVLTKFGYWTDNGGSYYYKFDEKLGYAGTLLAVKDSFAKMGAPLGYMQLDSWFYPKGVRKAWDAAGGDLPFGEDVYRADAKLFPDGLAAFHQQIGLPLVTHARWVAPTSPYRHDYKMSGNVVVDPKFWMETAAYLKEAGVITYEQDWLDSRATTEMNVSDPSAFLNDMAASMKQQGLTMQYCMAPPSDYMASSQYQNLATIRTSDDRFEREHWDAFLYDSHLATALGAQPWADVFMSPETANLLIATLSGGPVGVGDALGKTNVDNLHHAMRADGVIVKPAMGLRPIERMYMEDAAAKESPMIAVASDGDRSSGDAYYVFAYPRKDADEKATVSLTELGIGSGAIAYDWVKKTAVKVAPGGSVNVAFDGGSSDGGVDAPDVSDKWGYMVIVPQAKDHVALIGDPQQFVTLGSKRILNVTKNGVGEKVAIGFADGEDMVTLTGYAPHQPVLQSTTATVKVSSYDANTGMFLLLVRPGTTRKAIISIQ